MRKPQLSSRQVVSQLQSELLFLFLKYKLAFRCEIEDDALANLPAQRLKKILTHCWFHATFGNTGRQVPQVFLQIKNTNSTLEFIIQSSGTADCFFEKVEAYCTDHLLLESLRKLSGEQAAEAFPQPENVQVEGLLQGSDIRYTLKP